MEALIKKQVTSTNIMQVGMSFWSSKTLLTAVKLDLFTCLAKEPMSAEEIRNKLGLHTRSIYDFLDSLVALNFLTRKGLKETAVYSNTEDTNWFLDKNKPTYVGALLEMADERLYPFWNHLEEALKTGKHQNETKNQTKSLYEVIYSDKTRTEKYLNAMTCLQRDKFVALAKEFDWSQYKSCCDIGGAAGDLCIQIANHNSNIHCTTFDLPEVTPFATANVQNAGVANRVNVVSGNFFTDVFPKADVYAMCNILHNWGVEDKLALISKAYNALPKGGALVVIEDIIDDKRKDNLNGLLMSLNMLIETREGFQCSKADFTVWAEKCGFRDVYTKHLEGASSALIAVK